MFLSKLSGRDATHQRFQLAEGNRGAVEEIGREPALVLITVSDGCAWEGETERESYRMRVEETAAAEREEKASGKFYYIAIIIW